MIRVYRGREPIGLETVRQTQLAHLKTLGAIRPVQGTDVDGYRIVAADLWRRQHLKCCYCERQVTRAYNDVEHYRPKGRANRHPGCTEDHGYYWLAFSWDNLLFACDVCNRSNKNDGFPLDHGSVALAPWEDPPGKEIPLLLDPASKNGVPFIEFSPWTKSPLSPSEMTYKDVLRWEAQPRTKSAHSKHYQRAWHSINTFGLNHSEFVELYLNYVRDTVWNTIIAVRAAIRSNRTFRVQEEVIRAKRYLLIRSVPYVGLSYDALRFFVPPKILKPFDTSWPLPGDVGSPRPK